jgi:hypothetical protein
MRLKVVPYDEDYLGLFSYRGEERKYFSSDEEVRKVIRERAQKEGVTLVGLFQGKVIFFEGIYLVSPQVGEAWIFLNPPPTGSMISICKAVLGTMYSTAEEMNLVRLQSLCLPLEKTKKFLEFLGFELEAVLHNYHNGILDALVYIILWRERCQE